jgi:hypothetical protein
VSIVQIKLQLIALFNWRAEHKSYVYVVYILECSFLKPKHMQPIVHTAQTQLTKQILLIFPKWNLDLCLSWCNLL